MRTCANAVCDHVNKEKSRDADTNNKEEKLKTNNLSCGSIHNVHESLVAVLVNCYMLQSFCILLGLSLLSLCVPSSLVVNAPNLFTF